MSASKSSFFERVFRGSKSRGFSKRHESGRFTCLFDLCAGCPGAYLRFVRIFGTRRQTDMRLKGHWSPAPAGRVFKGQKISGLLFKISGSDFKIRATNFFFAPMRGKRSENQFSIFRTKKLLFPERFTLSFLPHFRTLKSNIETPFCSTV